MASRKSLLFNPTVFEGTRKTSWRVVTGVILVEWQNQVCAKLLHLWPTLCYPMDCSSPGSSINEILQASILEWVAISSSRGSFRPRDWTHISCVSCISTWILYHHPTWEAQQKHTRLILYWPKSSFRFFCNILWKNPNKVFGQSNKYHSPLKGKMADSGLEPGKNR